MLSIKVLAVLLLGFFGLSKAYENTGSNVAVGLIDCYNKTELADRENRFPTTMNVLIDIFRRTEDSRTNLDARALIISAIYRFRQDGIQQGQTENKRVFPYTPQGFQLHKNRLLLQKILPGSPAAFPNDTLSASEKCSLHFMMSNTIETQIRGDESLVCNKLGRYKLRTKREYEIMEPTYKSKKNKGNLVEVEEPLNTKTEDVPVDVGRRIGGKAVNEAEISECPIESGVVYTKWGSVQAGTVLAGIAAGFEPQLYPFNGVQIDSRFAATLAGDLAETALIQGVSRDTYEVGTNGDFQSTLEPRNYYLSQKRNHEMTDSEIRGGLDGLIIAKSIDEWKRKVPSIKVSQILDMYYSENGVFGSEVKACDRQKLRSKFATEEELKAQTLAFGLLINDKTVLLGTVSSDNVKDFTIKATDNLLQYDSKMNDVNCDTTEVVRGATELLIVLDTAWEYKNIQPVLFNLIQNLDVNKFGSNYTIINAKDGEMIVDNSNTILDFLEKYNQTVHDKFNKGFESVSVLSYVNLILNNHTNADKVTRNSGGRSITVLLVPNVATIPSNEFDFAEDRKTLFKTYQPDTKFLVMGPGNSDVYSCFVQSKDLDVFTLPQTTDHKQLENQAIALNKRIKEIPRRIKNPRCNADFVGDASSDTMDQYIEPGTVNYYRISPNYLYGDVSRSLKIKGTGTGSVIVCGSTNVERPRQNGTGNEDCETISTNEKKFDLGNYCTGAISSCKPFYVSIEAPLTPSPTLRCTEVGCRFPHNIKIVIATEGFECHSGSKTIFGSVFLISVMLYMLSL